MAGGNHAPLSVATDGFQGRKRNVTIAGIDSSPGSIDDAEDHDGRDDKRRQPVKRACNECRQQKVGGTIPFYHSIRHTAGGNTDGVGRWIMLERMRLANPTGCAIASMRRHSRSLERLFQMPPTETRLQDRVQLQASRKTQPQRRDGTGDY